MNLQPKIKTLQEKKLVGKKLTISFADNKTHELWSSFMPCRKEIKNNVANDLFSIEVYPASFFKNFNPATYFEKWAAIEVTGFDKIPESLEKMILPTGLYAVFLYKGKPSEGAATYQYIFQSWLPASEFILDNRPHFAVMSKKYKGEDPLSEEEIWIPVKQK